MPYIIIGVMGGGHGAARHHRRARPLLARRRHRRAGRDELRVLRRHARHGVGQRLPDGAVPVVRRRRAGRHRPRHGRVSAPAMEALLASPTTAPLLTRERVSPLFFLSYTLHPALDHRVSAHHDLLPHRAAARCSSSGRSSSIRSASWRSGCRACSSASRPTRMRDVPRIEQKLEARRALAAAPRRRPADAERAALRRAAAGDDVILVMLERLRAALAGRAARRRHHGGGHGERLADPRVVHDVHRGRVRVLRRAARFGEAVQVQTGRLFVVLLTLDRPMSSPCRVPQTHLRSGGPVRVLGLRVALAAAVCGAVLEAQHEVGRPRGRAVDRLRGDLHRPRARRARLGRPACRSCR